MVRACDGCWCSWRGVLRVEEGILCVKMEDLADVVVRFVPRERSPRLDLLQLRQAIVFILG